MKIIREIDRGLSIVSDLICKVCFKTIYISCDKKSKIEIYS